jgi:hypothetical protein
MSQQKRLFGLTQDEEADLGIQFEHELDRSVVQSAAGELFQIRNCLNSAEQRELKNYEVQCCHTGVANQSAITCVRSHESGNTIGYIFPVTAFREQVGEPDDWITKFADVAFRGVVSKGFLTSFANAGDISALRDREIYLDDILSDDVSILVYGSEVAKSDGLDQAMIELSMLKSGIMTLSDLGDLDWSFPDFNYTKNLNIKKVSPVFCNETSIIKDLICISDMHRSSIGSFLSLYQALEFCIDCIFEWGVHQISTMNLDTWQLKDQLSRITTERRRLAILDSCCLSRMTSRTSLTDLKDSCIVFLQKLGVGEVNDMNWHQALYKVRNIFVHNQIKMMKSQNSYDEQFYSVFRKAVLDVIFSLRQAN